MSDWTARGAAQLTHGRRTKVSSEMTLSLIAREDLLLAAGAGAVVLALGLHSFLRVRASASACLPSISCSPAFSRSV